MKFNEIENQKLKIENQKKFWKKLFRFENPFCTLFFVLSQKWPSRNFFLLISNVVLQNEWTAVTRFLSFAYV